MGTKQRPDRPRPARANPTLARAAPTGVASVLDLQRHAGNLATTALLEQLTRPSVQRQEAGDDGPSIDGLLQEARLLATGIGLAPIRIGASVGREGRNAPDDVQSVRARLWFLGYQSEPSLDGLAAAIERYQAEVVGLRSADGRVDVGGRTIAALGAMRRHPPVAAAPAAPAAPAASGEQHAAPAAAADQHAAPAAAGELADLVVAAHDPHVDAAAAALADLQHRSRTIKRGGWGAQDAHSEELGKDRDELVAAIGRLRPMVAGLHPPAWSSEQVRALQAAFYRAINMVTPFYYQHNNVMFEYSKERGSKRDVWNTCNITSLSMVLEAFGKTSAAYGRQERLGPVLEYFKGDLGGALDRTGSDLSGYRLPDVLGMAAVVEVLGGIDAPTDKQMDKAAGDAMGWLPNIKHLKVLASRFGMESTIDGYRHDQLAAYGKEHWRLAGHQGDLRKRGEATSAEGLSDADIESQVPLEQYRRAILTKLQPVLDQGKQVVVGQFNHFVRLKALDENGIVKDDPGNPRGATLRHTWEEARALGLFENFLIVG
jgi:hypothetical protein